MQSDISATYPLKSSLFSTRTTSVTSRPLVPKCCTSATENRECTSSEQELKHGWKGSQDVSFTFPPELSSIIQNWCFWSVSASIAKHAIEQISLALNGRDNATHGPVIITTIDNLLLYMASNDGQPFRYSLLLIHISWWWPILKLQSNFILSANQWRQI